MSYSCFISFKKMNEKDIIPFFRNYKKITTERLKDIAEENHSYPPYIRNSLEIPKTLKEVPDEEVRKARSWARCSVFQYKYFYDTKNELLCVFGIPTCMRDQFDTTIYFQNSCDQDYERENWEGIEAFEKVFDKWHSYTQSYIKRMFKKKYGSSFDYDYEGYEGERLQQKIDYYRRSFAYDEIWEQIEHELYCEEESIYISLYGNYEIREIVSFVKLCHEAHVAWEEEFEREWKKNHPEEK